MSTILKWAGNKTAIMSELKKHLPDGPRLVEPFAGSCAVMMATDYPYYLVADINPDLINLYQVIKEDVNSFIHLVERIFSKFTTEEDYYKCRQFFNTVPLEPIEKAAYFLFLNRHCYRGLCRYNQRGLFNVPYGNYKNPYLPVDEVRAFAEKAVRATFICASYDETLAMLQAGDVVYCDPPYDGTFSGYHTAGFSDDDQYDLASILVRRSSEGHPIIVSNSDTRLIRSFYRKFTLHRISTKRSIGVAAGEGKKADELIAVLKPKMCVSVDPGGPDCSVVWKVPA
ncbi:TPA: DNA adenine methylase [Enterobacter hormaechei]|uniref:DNA adenine methylase n=1 Tax=Enterobacter hormaechei TaxID=158836 RepID=UPI0005285619|nr:DNA adenine methylase [Enterobacter hormaechei]ASP01179.1 DNA adenine methylase [Enterobacter hormaechei]KVJ79778.1 DNA adenine methylase [Enterobacter hormaechei subsp. steigerwaltii]MCU3536289.1 DNA adenine methylase [Enterobacter hormaechei subsp. steigerwaltii]MDE7790604.1 DNA adenine methylase [Enterobacter hormaechei]HAS1298291.1 DNA adenine methylase [Enterobacter hormaechei]